MDEAIVLENLTKKFKDFIAVDNLNLTIAHGSTLGLIGANGAGKTTTIAMIMGLILPTAGTVRILGHDMKKRPPQVLKKMNFQSPYVGMPSQLSVWENLHVFGRLYNIPNLKQRLDEVITDFSLSDIAYNQTGLLSAGQKTRVSLAKALINYPEILLLDEPTASLDPERAEWIRSHLNSYQKKHNAAILLSSHNMLEVKKLCNHVAIMSYGKITHYGPIKNMLKHMFYYYSDYEEYAEDYSNTSLESPQELI